MIDLVGIVDRILITSVGWLRGYLSSSFISLFHSEDLSYQHTSNQYTLVNPPAIHRIIYDWGKEMEKREKRCSPIRFGRKKIDDLHDKGQ